MYTDSSSLIGLVSALWFAVAILAGGYARTRNRSAWTWFLLVLFFGPFAAALLVSWPPRVAPGTTSADTSEGRGRPPSRTEAG